MCTLDVKYNFIGIVAFISKNILTIDLACPLYSSRLGQVAAGYLWFVAVKF